MIVDGGLNHCCLLTVLLVALLSIEFHGCQAAAVIKCHHSAKLLTSKADIDAAATTAPAGNDCTGVGDDKGCFKLYSKYSGADADTKQVILGFGCGECPPASSTGDSAANKQARDMIAAFKGMKLMCAPCTSATKTTNNCNNPLSDTVDTYKAKADAFKTDTTVTTCPHFQGDYKADKAYTGDTKIYCKIESGKDTCASTAYLEAGKPNVYMGCKFDCDEMVKGKKVNDKDDAVCKKCSGTDSAAACSPDGTKLPTLPPSDTMAVSTTPTKTPTKTTPTPTTSGAADAGTGLHSVVLFLPLTAAAALALVPRL